MNGILNILHKQGPKIKKKTCKGWNVDWNAFCPMSQAGRIMCLDLKLSMVLVVFFNISNVFSTR